MEEGLRFDGRDVPDRLEQAAVVEPVDPSQRCELDGLEASPWPSAADDLGLEEPDHAIEVELPFLQAIPGDMLFVRLQFGAVPAPAIAAEITRLWKPETALAISSDLSHSEPYDAAQRRDLATASAIEARAEAAIGPTMPVATELPAAR